MLDVPKLRLGCLDTCIPECEMTILVGRLKLRNERLASFARATDAPMVSCVSWATLDSLETTTTTWRCSRRGLSLRRMLCEMQKLLHVWSPTPSVKRRTGVLALPRGLEATKVFLKSDISIHLRVLSSLRFYHNSDEMSNQVISFVGADGALHFDTVESLEQLNKAEGFDPAQPWAWTVQVPDSADASEPAQLWTSQGPEFLDDNRWSVVATESQFRTFLAMRHPFMSPLWPFRWDYLIVADEVSQKALFEPLKFPPKQRQTPALLKSLVAGKCAFENLRIPYPQGKWLISQLTIDLELRKTAELRALRLVHIKQEEGKSPSD